MKVHYIISEILKQNQVIAEMLDSGEVALIGSMYDVDMGMVTFYDK